MRAFTSVFFRKILPQRIGRLSAYLLALVVLFPTLDIPLWADPPRLPDFLVLDRQLRQQELALQLAETRLERHRLDVLARAQELDLQREQSARNEREQIQRRVKELELKVEQKNWALRQFEVEERSLIPTTDNIPKLMKRWQRARNLAKQQFLNFPEKSRGAIKSGRALNFFLNVCGPTALDHQIYREQLGAAKLILRHSTKESPPDDHPVPTDPKAALLDEIRGHEFFTKSDLENINVQKGLIGQKLKTRLNADEPLPLDWPPIIKINAAYRPYLAAIEKAKKDAIAHLKIPRGRISVSVQTTLMTQADRLCRAFEADIKKYFRYSRRRDWSPRKGLELTAARRFLREMRGGITRFVQARRIEHVQPAPFPPKGVEAVSVDQLMAFMCRHGLQFAAADTNADSSYQLVYRQMARYYVDLYGLHLAIQSDKNKVRLHETQIDKLFEARRRNVDDVLIASQLQPEPQPLQFELSAEFHLSGQTLP